ncbi:hypothetical protein EJB05_22034, partial [Eragrostis curvula]
MGKLAVVGPVPSTVQVPVVSPHAHRRLNSPKGCSAHPHRRISGLAHEMPGNNVIWQPEEVEDLLLYYKEKIQASGKTLVLREVHHEECARRINQKYATNFTGKQVYYKYHKLKGEWKVILKAKSANGASFDDQQKKIIYDKIEVVKMKAKGDKRTKFYNVPIPFYGEMEFVFMSKHATEELNVPQSPFDCPLRHEDGLIGNGRPIPDQMDGDIDPSQHNVNGSGSDTPFLGSDSPSSVGLKRKSKDKKRKRKRVKRYYALVQDVVRAVNNMSDTMRFTHVTDPNESIYKAIDDMQEYPLPLRLDLQIYLAQNGNIASMLKGRPEEAIKQWVARWVRNRYPTGYKEI